MRKVFLFILIIVGSVSFSSDAISGWGRHWGWADPAAPESLAITADTTLTKEQFLEHKFFTNQEATGEIDVILPVISYRVTRIFICEEAQNIEINPPSGEAPDLDGTTLDANDCIDSDSTVGSKIAVTRMKNASGIWIWSLDTIRGTWSDTGASD